MSITMATAAIISGVIGLIGGAVGDSINRSFNSNEAEKARQFNRQERLSAEAFNASEAEKARDWQEYMTSSAHQREVADLRAAGLNPILSANSGAGAGSAVTAVSPFGGSSASASYNNNSSTRAAQALSQTLSSAYATDLEFKLKSEPRFEDKVQNIYRNGKLVRKVVTKGSSGLQ